MSLYDQLIEFAREKQRKRRIVGIHKSVANPIIVLVVGDKQLDDLDALYTQLKSRWSSQLKALQVCYCYVKAPYTGSSPILQTKLELPEAGGPGALCTVPDTLGAVNRMMSQAIDRINQEDQVHMAQAKIHIVLAPEDPAGALVSDLAAVAKGRLEDFGVLTNDCRLYLLLPKSYESRKECARVCGVMDQLKQAEQYEQAVLQPQPDAAPRMCRIDRLINAVMLLDDLNENYQRCNLHGERLGLLLDLVENGWNNTGFIQTAGVQDGSAGPEYWLAQAAYKLCCERQTKTGKSEAEQRLQAIVKQISSAVQSHSSRMEQAVRMCCLFRPGQVERVARFPLDEGETAVFGGTLRSAYESWRESLAGLELPDAVMQIVDEIELEADLDALIRQMEDWVGDPEERQPQMPDAACPQLFCDKGEAAAALRLRDFLWTEKYLPMVKKVERDGCAELARLCAGLCQKRKETLRTEEEEFAGFVKEIQQVWFTLRDAYDDGGGRMDPMWISKPPAPGALRRAGAAAFRTGDASQALAMAAECVDLNGQRRENAPRAELPLFCRIPFATDLNTRVQPITQGVSDGRVLKFAVISREYDEEALRCVYALKYAWENEAAE